MSSRAARPILLRQTSRASAHAVHGNAHPATTSPSPHVHMLRQTWSSTSRLAAALLLLPATIVACADPSPTGPELQAGRVRQPTAPGSPTWIRATAGDAAATIQWAAPKKDGGSPVTSYTVTSSPDGKTATVNGSTLVATVGELRNGTSYTFTVVATNAVGSSAPSTPSNAVTPTGTVEPPPPDTTTPPPPPPPTGRWISGYYVGYQRDLYPVETVDFSVLTHLFVGRITPRADGTVTTHFDINDTEGPAMARRLAERAHQAGRKAVLMLGGAGEHANFVSAASDANRAKFVTNLLATMDDLGYDGIDVDWEPVEQADEAPLLDLLRRLRTARPNMILTMPVGWINPNYQTVDPFYVQAVQYLDQMNIMSYYMAGAWGGWSSWHSSALHDGFGDHPSSVSGSAQMYVSAGIPRERLGIGLGFFGMCWRGVTGPRQYGG